MPEIPLKILKFVNAVTMATPEFCAEIWPWWVANENKLMQECLYKGHPSEMVLLRNYYGNSPCLDYYFPEIASYKMHIQTKFVSLSRSQYSIFSW